MEAGQSAQGERRPAGALADARLTALLYVWFEQQVQDGKMNPKSLTGTLSILAQAYVTMNDSARAKTIFAAGGQGRAVLA